MPEQPIFSFELIDNKIPCGGFNLLGGGVKGRNIESKESQSLIFSLYEDERVDQSVTPQRLLMLNFEDYQRILPILDNPPSDEKVVATNLRFTCLNYYDVLQIVSKLKENMDRDELASLFNKVTNGNIVTLYDIANLYTKELGIKTVPYNGKDDLIDLCAEIILQQYYQQQRDRLENWIKNTTVWATDDWSFADNMYFFGINQKNLGSAISKNFVLDFTAKGNILTYMPE